MLVDVKEKIIEKIVGNYIKKHFEEKPIVMCTTNGVIMGGEGGTVLFMAALIINRIKQESGVTYKKVMGDLEDMLKYIYKEGERLGDDSMLD